ncbi:hypothetical protein ACWCQQ_36825 [Streptomyces sp. NPDC002143]
MSNDPHVPPTVSPRSTTGPPCRRALLGAMTVSAVAGAPLLAAAPAEAASSGAGDLLYVGTWGVGQVHALRFDPAHGTTTQLGPVAQAGSHWVVAHPTKVDPRSGRLTDIGASVPVPKPDCVAFSRR